MLMSTTVGTTVDTTVDTTVNVDVPDAAALRGRCFQIPGTPRYGKVTTASALDYTNVNTETVLALAGRVVHASAR